MGRAMRFGDRPTLEQRGRAVADFPRMCIFMCAPPPRSDVRGCQTWPIHDVIPPCGEFGLRGDATVRTLQLSSALEGHRRGRPVMWVLRAENLGCALAPQRKSANLNATP